MWPILLVYSTLALPLLAEVHQSVTVRALIPPGDFVGVGIFLAGQLENVYGFVQYCDKCEGLTPMHTPWMLLTSLTNCPLEAKLKIAAEKKAVAVIIIADVFIETALQSSYITMKSSFERKYGPGSMDMPVILVTKENSKKLISINQAGGIIPVILEPLKPESYERSSLMAVVVVFLVIVLFLIVCYFMYAKKDSIPLPVMNCPYQIAVSKIPTQELTDTQDPVCDEESKCAICLEGFQVKEIISHLPCKHIFHKECIDPWLIEKRVCPMCKMDVVKFYGPVNLGSEESIVDMPLDDNLIVNTLTNGEALID